MKETDPTSGYTVTSDPADGKVTLSINSKTGTVTITNTQSTTDVEVSKIVTGNMGDQSKNFSFTATLTNAQNAAVNFPEPPAGSGYTVSGNVATFDLAHNEKVTLFNIPVGSSITIVESDNTDYIVSVKKDGSLITDPTVSESDVTVTISGNTAIEFTNNREVLIDTGVPLDSFPYILMLALTGIGGASGLTRKRKFTDLD